MTPEQFDRLPKYARDEIRRLRSNLELMQRENRQLFGNEKTRVRLLRFVDMEDQPLPDNAIMQFDLEDGGRRRMSVECRLDGDTVNIHGYDGILIEPVASNACRIKLRPR